MFIDFNNLSMILTIPILLILICFGGLLYAHGIIYLGGIRKSDIEEISPKALNVLPKFLKKHLK